MPAYTKGLHTLADGVSAWLLPDGSWGWSNAGFIAGDGEGMLVDTLFDLALTRELLDGLEPLTGSAPIRHLVNTHANGDHCFGNQLVPPDAHIYAGPHFNEELHEFEPTVYGELAAAQTDPTVAAYLHEAFGPFDHSGIRFRDATVTVTDRLTVDVAGRGVELHHLGPAHTRGDVIAWVPDSQVLFAGDLLFIGGAPVMWAGPARSWSAACDRMIALEPETVVPGHGPVTDVSGIREVRDYLDFIGRYAAESHAAGLPWPEAARRIDLGPFASLGDSERVVANLYCEYRHLDPATPALPLGELIAEMARWRTRGRAAATHGGGQGRRGR
ncbi:MBL fold metallo-hydrolase [Streptomyces sp. NPDC004610]|uniref:MBL fold metallo-hydrolase n=1 Tax=unclassified Streptomyces TaxID=2593676 RepID=UPI0033B4DB0C